MFTSSVDGESVTVSVLLSVVTVSVLLSVTVSVLDGGFLPFLPNTTTTIARKIIIFFPKYHTIIISQHFQTLHIAILLGTVLA